MLITDAGSRGATDRYSATRQDAVGMKNFLDNNRTALMVLHMKTPQGASNHAYAAQQYARVSEFGALGPQYFPVERGDEGNAEAKGRELVAAMRRIASAQQDRTPPPAGQPDDIGRRAELLGYALRLAWLGRHLFAWRSLQSSKLRQWLRRIFTAKPIPMAAGEQSGGAS